MSHLLQQQLKQVIEDKSLAWATIQDLTDQVVQFDIVFEASVLDQFAQFCSDLSPIHMSHERAVERGFLARVVHGGIQAAIVSTLVGMVLPGERSVIQLSQYKFHQPCYVDQKYHYIWCVENVIESVKVIEASLTVTDEKGNKCVKGHVQIGITEDE